MRRSRRSGFTVLEVMIAAVILGLITLNMSMVMKASSAAYGTGVFNSMLEDQADLAMDRLSLAMMTASASKLVPAAGAPFGTASIEYQTSLGWQEGEAVYGEPERIELVPGAGGAPGQILWRENPGAPGERNAVWSSWVRAMQGSEKKDGVPEIPNEVDDNANGLVDEPGLAFETKGTKLNIFLTLERKNSEGRTFTQTRKTIVTCRN